MRSYSYFLAAVLAGSAVTPLEAQEAHEAPRTAHPVEAGARALSFSLPDGAGGRFGYWRVRSEQAALGFFVGVHASHGVSEQGSTRFEGTELSVSLGPALRRYLYTGGTVLPFLQVSPSLGYGIYRRSVSDSRRDREVTRHHLLGAVGGGAGVEWFPVRQVSVSGHTGAQLALQYGTSDVEPEDPEGGPRDWRLRFDTFTSVLNVSLYLPPRVQR